MSRAHGAQALHLLKTENADPDVVAAELPTLRIEPVLTAHPTEARRRSVLACMQEIYGILMERSGHGDRHPGEQDRRSKLKVVLERWWRTEEVRTQRPTVDMEREGVIHCLAGSMAESIALTDRRLQDGLGSCGFGKRWARPSGGATDTLLWNVGGWRSGRASFSHPYYNQAKLV